MLRSAIRDPEGFAGHSTGHGDLDRLLTTWSDDQRRRLQVLEADNTLPRAMNDAFLSDAYTPDSVREHEVLGTYLRHLGDDVLSELRDQVSAKRCQDHVQPRL